jgi:ATP/maltotriose-dependent transcriptional regulator MalT
MSQLIERDNFLNQLNAGYEKMEKGEGHCFFIMGEAGIGKTSLVKAFFEKLDCDGKSFVGACDSLFTPRPLAPLYDIALQIKTGLADKIESITSRTALFTKFIEELTGLQKPIVLVFEDIHWADEATLDFIKFFARRISRLKCLFILTYRNNDINTSQRIKNLIGDLSADSFTRLLLPPLSREAVNLLSTEKGFDAANVYDISRGNPFYVTEILASYSNGIPENIKDSVLSVYHQQNEQTKGLWEFLSVIPEGLELNRFVKTDPLWQIAIEYSLTATILEIRSHKIYFKHELYRRTIEDSLSPFKRIALNKKILDLYLNHFIQKDDIERIVHYAKNANEYHLVVEYAPIAAKKAASVGAHVEASKLYFTAIEYYDGHDKSLVLKFYESYTYECYLTNQIKEAIIYQGKILRLLQLKKEVSQIDIHEMSNCLRFLSRLWWFEGNREEAEKYGQQAIQLLEEAPESAEKAMAFSNMSQLKMLSGEFDKSIELGNLAIAMAKNIKNDEILSHALNNVGTSEWEVEYNTTKRLIKLKESLAIALKHSLHEHAARAYTNIISSCIAFKDYAIAMEYLEEGLKYCEERDLDSWTKYILSMKAVMLLEMGDWEEALNISDILLNNPTQTAVVKIGAYVVKTRIEMRQGKPGVPLILNEALSVALKTKEYRRIIPVIIACLEYEWLNNSQIIGIAEVEQAIVLAKYCTNSILKDEFYFWLNKSSRSNIELSPSFKPYKLLATGEQKIAANYWKNAGLPYENALALAACDEEDKREALVIMQDLGADAVYQKLKLDMRTSGLKKIPRGKRESTKANILELTNRELEVLQLLKGGTQNKEIAAALFISAKTVDHHISSILFKLSTPSRSRAVEAAIRLGIIT